MPVDDAELTRRLAALEAEVKADADAQKARKDAALAKLREQQAQKQAEKDEAAARTAAAAAKRPRARAKDDDEGSSTLDNAIVLAKGAKLAAQAKDELSRPREKGEKSWLASTGLSLLFGPVGWLYAGSFREAIPAAFIYVLFAAIAAKLPVMLLWPAMMIILPLSAIGGLVYAIQYNRTGKRVRLFDKDKKDAARKRLTQ